MPGEDGVVSKLDAAAVPAPLTLRVETINREGSPTRLIVAGRLAYGGLGAGRASITITEPAAFQALAVGHAYSFVEDSVSKPDDGPVPGVFPLKVRVETINREGLTRLIVAGRLAYGGRGAGRASMTITEPAAFRALALGHTYSFVETR